MSADAVGDGLALLSVTFRAELDRLQTRSYRRALKGYDAETILMAADALIEQAAGGRKFYPLPTAPDLVGACDAVLAERRRQVVARYLSVCDHHGHWIDDGDRVRRCPCWVAAIAAGKELSAPREAARPELVRLPSWHHPDEQDEAAS